MVYDGVHIAILETTTRAEQFLFFLIVYYMVGKSNQTYITITIILFYADVTYFVMLLLL